VAALVGAGWKLANAGGRWCTLALILALQFLRFTKRGESEIIVRHQPESEPSPIDRPHGPWSGRFLHVQQQSKSTPGGVGTRYISREEGANVLGPRGNFTRVTRSNAAQHWPGVTQRDGSEAERGVLANMQPLGNLQQRE
jgi:hypothetical protein